MNELKPRPAKLTPAQWGTMLASVGIGILCGLPWYVAVGFYMFGVFLGGCLRKAKPQVPDAPEPQPEPQPSVALSPQPDPAPVADSGTQGRGRPFGYKRFDQVAYWEDSELDTTSHYP